MAHDTKDELYGSKELWQELMRTRKALEQSEICCTEWEKRALDYKAENIALSGDLELTHKALEIAVDGIKYMRNNCLEYAADYMDKADDILEQIKKVNKNSLFLMLELQQKVKLFVKRILTN